MTEPEHASLDARRRRLLYRATHRGTYENDILLGGFVQRHLAAFDEFDLAALEALLELPDGDLADWFTGRSQIPPEADTPLMRRIHEEAQNPLSREAGEGREGVRPAGRPPPQPSLATREGECDR